MGLLTRLALHDTNALAEKRTTFVSQFNRSDAVPLESEDFARTMATAQACVCKELTRPSSAEFEQTHVRFCSDKIIRAAGILRFAGSAGQISSKGFLIEFNSDGRAKLLEFVDFDPVTLKHPSTPHTSEDGVLLYQAAGASEDERLPWLLIVVLIVAVFCVGVLLVNAFWM